MPPYTSFPHYYTHVASHPYLYNVGLSSFVHGSLGNWVSISSRYISRNMNVRKWGICVLLLNNQEMLPLFSRMAIPIYTPRSMFHLFIVIFGDLRLRTW
jgi:hypothetical protein